MSSTWSLAARVHRSQRLISHGLIDEVSSRLVKSRTGMHFIGRKGRTENTGGERRGEGERQEGIYIARERDREGETYEEGRKAVKGKSKRYRYAQGISDRRTGLAISRWVIVRRIQCTQILNEARKFIQKNLYGSMEPVPSIFTVTFAKTEAVTSASWYRVLLLNEKFTFSCAPQHAIIQKYRRFLANNDNCSNIDNFCLAFMVPLFFESSKYQLLPRACNYKLESINLRYEKQREEMRSLLIWEPVRINKIIENGEPNWNCCRANVHRRRGV